MNDAAAAIAHVEDVLTSLLDEEHGCPWDKEQTPLSLTEYIIEECFEMVDAIRKEKAGHVCDEMGDLLFLLIFVARKYGHAFTFADALQAGADKMRRRHPHVFGDAKVENGEELHAVWESIKKAEKKAAGEEKNGVFASLPDGLPPLTKAYRIHSKAASAGFTWDEDEEVERQVEAEWLELLDAKESGDSAAMEHELGDMFFALTEMGRRMNIKAAQATDMTCRRFLERFEAMEAMAAKQGREFKELSLDEKDELWEQAKQREHASLDIAE